MSPVLFGAIAAAAAVLAALIPIFVVLAPVARRWIDANIERQTALQIRDVVHNAFEIISGLAKVTPTDLDDAVARLLEIADREFRAIKGRPMTDAERQQARHAALALHAGSAPGVLTTNNAGLPNAVAALALAPPRKP